MKDFKDLFKNEELKEEETPELLKKFVSKVEKMDNKQLNIMRIVGFVIMFIGIYEIIDILFY